MTQRDHFRLIAAGFSLIYLATMGALVTLGMPFLEGARNEIFMFVILPIGTIGLILTIVAHRLGRDPSAENWTDSI